MKKKVIIILIVVLILIISGIIIYFIIKPNNNTDTEEINTTNTSITNNTDTSSNSGNKNNIISGGNNLTSNEISIISSKITNNNATMDNIVNSLTSKGFTIEADTGGYDSEDLNIYKNSDITVYFGPKANMDPELAHQEYEEAKTKYKGETSDYYIYEFDSDNHGTLYLENKNINGTDMAIYYELGERNKAYNFIQNDFL